MRTAASCLASLLLLSAVACGPGSPGGPASGRMGARESHPLESKEIMDRSPQTERAVVKHILIGWRDLEGVYGDRMDPRAKKRSRWDAEKLTKKLHARVKAGEAIEALMNEHSEDPGSAATGNPYEVLPESKFVPEFLHMSLRLKVGEAGKVLTQFGWHIILRVE
jgi:hypothetical protein